VNTATATIPVPTKPKVTKVRDLEVVHGFPFAFRHDKLPPALSAPTSSPYTPDENRLLMEAYDYTTTKLQQKVRDQSRDKKTKTPKWEKVAHFYNRGARYYSWVNQSAVIRERTAASLKQRRKTNNKAKAPKNTQKKLPRGQKRTKPTD
jgi:hypothetical protein